MKILAVDSSATAASAAVTEGGRLLGEFYLHTSLTHSQTLMPMIEALLRNARIAPEELDLLAVSVGPGSFTGVRIGVASIKGMAMALQKPCAGVSTLEAMAQNMAHAGGIICAVMDARCGQVYNALFQACDGKLLRLTDDRALAADTLAEELAGRGDSIFLVGDGAELCYNKKNFQQIGAQIAPEPLRFQRAWGVAVTASALQEYSNAAALRPSYLRVPQAERELKMKQAASAAGK